MSNGKPIPGLETTPVPDSEPDPFEFFDKLAEEEEEEKK